MNIGYAYWGFLADKKYNKKGELISTPDGNAFYSWSIIHSLIEAGHKVFQMMPNRDKPSERYTGLYDSFKGMGFGGYDSSNNPRYIAYKEMNKNLYDNIGDWKKVTRQELFDLWDSHNIDSLDVILLEWRMEIPGRNTEKDRYSKDWQPDLFIQNCIIEYCKNSNIKLIIFDLDYKLTYEDVAAFECNNIKYSIIELGHKWSDYEDVKSYHIEVPFDFRYINNFDICNTNLGNNLVYVGNRYERDWCIDKYIPADMHDIEIYGNWLESGRDSKERWPGIHFNKRINADEMYEVYNFSTCTILLAKEEYVKHGFMTVRVIESVYYGSLPLFINEFGIQTIKKYAGAYYSDLRVRDKGDVIEACMYYKYHQKERRMAIESLREHLKFMDSSIFVKELEEIIKNG